MPVLDPLKAALTDHLQTLIKNCTLGASGSKSSSRDSGAGNTQLSKNVVIQRVDDRTLSINAFFDSQQTSAQPLQEVVLHGTNALDTPAFRTTFLPIQKNTTNEVRIDILMEVR